MIRLSFRPRSGQRDSFRDGVSCDRFVRQTRGDWSGRYSGHLRQCGVLRARSAMDSIEILLSLPGAFHDGSGSNLDSTLRHNNILWSNNAL